MRPGVQNAAVALPTVQRKASLTTAVVNIISIAAIASITATKFINNVKT